MQDIVDYVAILKDQIAEKYILINLWNKIFREYQIEKYIDGAASFWGISIDKENVMKATGGSNSQLSFINKLIFNIGTKIYRGIFYLKNFKNMFCKI